MRVMVFIKATKDTEAGAMPSPQMWHDMERFQEEITQAGVLITGEGLMPSSHGVRILCSGPEHVVTDGPFSETKEIVAGYSIWAVISMAEAVAWAKRCPMPEGSEIELRPLFMYSEEEVSEIVSQS